MINLPAAERAIYLELEHLLRALDMTVKRVKKSESDREKRVAQALGESSTAEEALLKRCSHFELDSADRENAMKACEVIVEERKKRRAELDRQLEQLQSQAPRKRKELERLQAELQPLEAKRQNSTAAAREARRRKEEALGGVEDDLEERGRWYRAADASLRQMLEIET